MYLPGKTNVYAVSRSSVNDEVTKTQRIDYGKRNISVALPTTIAATEKC